MQAIVFEHPGNPSTVLSLREVARPIPGPGQLLVRVEARSLHPADDSFIRGTYRIRPMTPQIAGLVGAGRVIDAGPGVTAPIGARVAFRAPGAWAEEIACPIERAIFAPDDVSLEVLAQFALNPITAWALVAEANVHDGDLLGITAPHTSVAHLVRAIATQRGIRCLELGDPAPIAEETRAHTGKGGLAALVDSVGGPALQALFPTLREGATIVAYGTASPDPIVLRNATLIYSNLTWKGFGIDRWLRGIDAATRERMLAELWAGLRAGWLTLPVAARVPLADYPRALAAAAASPRGKVLLM